VNEGELTGRLRTHIEAVADPACHLHSHAVTPFLNLRKAAQSAGIDLIPLSSFRDFDRQLAIWNAKYCGERPMLDAAGNPLNASELAPRERIDAILLWSALPGASRHHWGTDLDLIDGNADTDGLKDRLTREAFAPEGPFGPLHRWLDEHAARFGFFRPYQGVRSGVQPEPWHFSFAPVAEKARRSLSTSVLRAALAAAPMQGKDMVLERLDALHARYVEIIDLP
jgi:LAS superfamily LD-carboxypeptidase LdcB